jgi:ERCC4-type nuclease
VDYREWNSGVLDALATMPHIDVSVEHLPVGDYLVDDVFVFERKTLEDLAGSDITDPRVITAILAQPGPTAD